MRSHKNRAATVAATSLKTVLGFILLGACATPAMRAADREPTSTASPEIKICQDGRDGWQQYRWCLTVPRDFRSRSLIYFFHGWGGDETTWQAGVRPQLETDWKSRNVAAPAVASITFGSSWFVSEQTGFVSRSTQDLIQSVIIPEIESHLPAPANERVLYGESMGAFNAIQLFAKDTGRWNRVALDCPAILAVGPTSTRAEIEAFIQRQKGVGRRDAITAWLGKLRNAFSAKNVWAKHDPLELAKRADVNSPRVLVIGADRDEYGFYEGVLKFEKTLQERGVRVETQNVSGFHCAHNPESLAALSKFLIPDSFQK